MNQRRPLLTWVAGAAWQHRGGVLLLLVLLVLQAIVQAVTPWPMKVLVDQVLSSRAMPEWLAAITGLLPGAGSRTGLLIWTVGATVIFFTAATVLSMVHGVLAVSVGQRLVYSTAGELFSKLQRLSLGFHARRSVGDLMKRITTDCAAIATIVRDALLPAVAAGASLVIMMAIMLALNPLMTVVALAAIPPIVVIARKLTPAVLERGYEYAHAEAGVWDMAQRTLAAVPVIQAFSAEPRADAVIRKRYDEVYTSALALTWAQFRLKVVSGLVMAIGAAAIALVGTHEVLAGRLTIGGMLVFMAYLAAMYAPIDAMIFATGAASEAAGGAQRVLELLGEVEDVADAPGAAPLVLAGPPEIEFERVTYGYESGNAVLQGVSLRIPAGATVALVGVSGAGKTTLAGLIPRLCDPQQGRVLIGSRDVRHCTLRSVREQVAILAQDTYLFPVSIAENIGYARPGAAIEEIQAAAKAAGADEFISRLPAGYETVVGERGATLSVGERQRIAIARAFLKDSPVLILDEPTSALDAASESLLLDSLEALRQRRTTIIIAHRLSTVRSADLIVVLEQGRVVETGTHQKLLSLGGRYAQLHRLQQGVIPESAP